MESPNVALLGNRVLIYYQVKLKLYCSRVDPKGITRAQSGRVGYRDTGPHRGKTAM
jgi:hypothetical protein